MAITEGDYLQIPRVDPVTNEDVPEDITDEIHDAMVGYLPNGRIGFHLIEAARRDSPATISVWRTHTRNNDGTLTELDPHVLLDGPRSVAPSSGQFYFSYDWNAIVLPASEINSSAPVDPDDKGAQGNRFRVAYRGTGASNHIANQQKIQDDALNARPTFAQLATSGQAPVHGGNIVAGSYYPGPVTYEITSGTHHVPVPVGCNKVDIICVGRGGNGGNGSDYADGGGGGSGGYATGTEDVSYGQTIPVSANTTASVLAVSATAGAAGSPGLDTGSPGGIGGSGGAGGSPGGNAGADGNDYGEAIAGGSGGSSPYGGYGAGGRGGDRAGNAGRSDGGSAYVRLYFYRA